MMLASPLILKTNQTRFMPPLSASSAQRHMLQFSLVKKTSR